MTLEENNRKLREIQAILLHTVQSNAVGDTTASMQTAKARRALERTKPLLAALADQGGEG